MQRFEAAYGRLLDALALLACALVFAMTVMICADVLLRNVRIIPHVVGLEWSNEVSEAMLYLVTLLTAPWLLRCGQHVRVDIVLRAVALASTTSADPLDRKHLRLELERPAVE